MCIFGPLGGLLVRKIGYRAVIILGVAASSVGFFTTSFVPNIYWAFLTLGLLTASGAGVEMLAGPCLIMEWFPSRNNARALCLALLGTSVGKEKQTPSCLPASLGSRRCWFIY